MLPAMGDGQVQPRNGLCKKWAKAGECAGGDDCPWAASHTKENKPKGKGKGEGKGKKGDRSTSPSANRERAPTPPRAKSPSSEARGNPERMRGKSPSGEVDRPACFRYLKGNCSDPNCRYWHPPACRDFKKGKCAKGSGCEFLHEKPNGNTAVQADKAQLKTARFL